jgi:hypothetical protein
MSTLARLRVAVLASGLLGCESGSLTPPPARDAALTANHTASANRFTAYPSMQTRGEVRVTLVSVGRTTRFVDQSVLDDERRSPRSPSQAREAVWERMYAVPCLEIEYVVEYLADVPMERRVFTTPTALIDGREDGRRRVADRWPGQSGVVVEMPHFYARPEGFPEVERPERAVYRQLIVWGIPQTARRIDVGFSEGTVERVEQFRFGAIPLTDARPQVPPVPHEAVPARSASAVPPGTLRRRRTRRGWSVATGAPTR